MKLLAEMKGGAAPPVLEVVATTYLQRKDQPNRRFVRFDAPILGAVAKSYIGQPFLRDHNSYELAARGGTIIGCKLVSLDDGSKAFEMRLQLVKDWAIEGVLDGTIDRFSIGWSRTDIVKCSVHKGQVFRDCDCMPGQKMSDGKVVEFIFTGAEGTEVSAVNVPAVVGTGIQAISQLDTLDRTTLTGILGGDLTPDPPSKDKKMDPQILAALGLSPTATLAEVLAAITSTKNQLTLSNATKANLETSVTELRAESERRATTERAAIVTASIAQLVHAGKILPSGDVEQALRSTANNGLAIEDHRVRTATLASSMTLFTAQVKELLSSGAAVTPVGAPPIVGGKDPVPPPAPLGVVLSGKDYLAANPGVAAWLAKAGITAEQFEKHGAGARQSLASIQQLR
jgi:hypothetical protein